MNDIDYILVLVSPTPTYYKIFTLMPLLKYIILIQVLRKIEEMKTRNLTPDIFRSQLDTIIKSNNLKLTTKMDIASHFILRAAYCRTEDLRRWFLTQECLLFRHRLESISKSGVAGKHQGGNDVLREFLRQNDFYLDRVSNSEKERLRDKLLCITGTNPVDYHTTEYYRVPFLQALELIGRRLCYVAEGYAYVPLDRVVSIIVAKFRSALSRSLAYASGIFSQVVTHDEASRIGPLLTSMNSAYTGPGGRDATSFGIDTDNALTSSNVDAMSTQSMPLCMRQLHRGLQRDHKLKHQGRLQYGLFLKGAGMSLEEHTLYFQREFTRIMTNEQFNKQYAYSIRHTHGKEGKRATYTPYNCMKIILGAPPQSGTEHHGCPYKHYDDVSLNALLGSLKIGTAVEREAIMSYKREGNYQLACTKHFETVHPGVLSLAAGGGGGGGQQQQGGSVSLDGVGNHPNAWFSASVSYHNVKSGSVGGGGGVASLTTGSSGRVDDGVKSEDGGV